MQSSTQQQQQQSDVTRRRFIQAVLQPGPVKPVIEELPKPEPEPEKKDEDVYDDQPAVFDMDEDDGDEGNGSAETDSAVSPNQPFTRPPRTTPPPERSLHEFMPSIAVSDQRSSSKLSTMSSSLSSSSSGASFSRLGMGRSVQPAFFGASSNRFGSNISDDDDDDDTTVVIAPHDVTAALSQPRVAASFGFVPPHLVSDLPDY